MDQTSEGMILYICMGTHCFTTYVFDVKRNKACCLYKEMNHQVAYKWGQPVLPMVIRVCRHMEVGVVMVGIVSV